MYFPKVSAASFYGSRYARTAATMHGEGCEKVQKMPRGWLSNSYKRVRYFDQDKKKIMGV